MFANKVTWSLARLTLSLRSQLSAALCQPGRWLKVKFPCLAKIRLLMQPKFLYLSAKFTYLELSVLSGKLSTLMQPTPGNYY
jgi:hypothetical protein